MAGMKRVFVSCLFVIAASGFAANASAQGFGITPGTPIRQLRVLTERSPTYFKVDPPSKHPDFSSYMVHATPQSGVCQVMGIGITLDNDSYGNKAHAHFAELSRQLAIKYGKSEEYDVQRPNSIWNERREWAIGIAKGERYLTRIWSKKSQSSLPPGTAGIMLETAALDSNRTYLTLTYEFENSGKCEKEITSNNASRL